MSRPLLIPYTVLFQRGIWTVCGQANGTVRLLGTSLKQQQTPDDLMPLVSVSAPPSHVRMARYSTEAGMFNAGMCPTTFQWYLLVADDPSFIIPSHSNYLDPQPLPIPSHPSPSPPIATPTQPVSYSRLSPPPRTAQSAPS